MKIPVALYARVSSEKQAEGDSLEHQISLLTEYMKRQLGDEYYTDESLLYVDEAISGYYKTLLDRPAIQRMFNEAEKGRFKVALFKEISRMGRDEEEIIKVPRIFESYGIRVIATNDYYDSNNPDSKIFFSLSSALAEKESEKISTRVSSGHREKARKGQWATVAPVGYKINNETKRLEIDDETSFIPKLIFDLYVNKRLGTTTIANKLNEMGLKTSKGNLYEKAYVRGILINQVYIGTVIYGKNRNKLERIYDENKNLIAKKKKMVPRTDYIEVPNAHPPLIDSLIFWKAQELMKSRSHVGESKRAAKHPLVGLAFCGKCNSSIICQCRRQIKGKYEYRYYKCSNHHRYGSIACDFPPIRADILEQGIYQAVIDHLQKLSSKTSGFKVETESKKLNLDLDKKINEKKKLIKQQGQMAHDRDLYTEDSFREIMINIKKQIELLEFQMSVIQKQIEEINKKESGYEFIKKMMDEVLNINLDNKSEMRSLFHEVIEKIVLNEDGSVQKLIFKHS